MGINDKWFHKCPFCNACFSPDNIGNLLSQAHLNNCIPKDYSSIEESEINEERRKKIITNQSNGTKEFSNERQIDDFCDFLDEVEPNNQLKTLSFATFGGGIIKGYEEVNSFIQSIVERLGGTYHTTKERAEFIICTNNSAKKILENKEHKLAKKKLVSVKFLAALSFGHCEKKDYIHYQFKPNTPEDTKKCPCSIDSNHNGIKEYPILLMAYYRELKRLFPNDENKVDSIFTSFLKRSRIHLDVLHYVKGNWMVVMAKLEELNLINIKEFKSKRGGKSKKSPNQMSGKKARNILAGYMDTIVPYLIATDKTYIISLLECMSVLQFLAYADYSIL
jgi:hypothetical protein